MNLLPREIVRHAMNKWKVQSSKCEEKIKKNILYAICFILITFVLISWNYTDAQVKLKTKMPDLCFDCHKELKKGLSDRYVHFLFKEGKCIACHNSHVGKLKGLMNEEIDTICLRCHEEISNLIKKATLHSALRENNCPECHYPHSGGNKYLLVKKEKTLCLNCHENLEKEFPGIKERICDEKGKVRRFINIYVNEEDVRFLKQHETPLKDGDEVSIIPAIAGG